MRKNDLDAYIGDGHPYLLRNAIHKNCLGLIEWNG